MRNLSRPFAVRPAATKMGDTTNKYMYFPLHGIALGTDSAGKVLDSGYANGNGGDALLTVDSGNLPIINTTTSQTDDPGWFSPVQGDTTRIHPVAGDADCNAIKAMCRLDDLSAAGAGGVICALRFKTPTSTVVTPQVLFSAYAKRSVGGGWGINIEESGAAIKVKPGYINGTDGSGAGSINPGFIATSSNITTDGAAHSAMLWIDCSGATPTFNLYIDGAADGTGTLSATGAIPRCAAGTNTNDTEDPDAFTPMLCAWANGAGPTYAQYLNVDGGGDAGFSDLWLIRSETDISGSVPAIAKAFHNDPYTLPSLLV